MVISLERRVPQKFTALTPVNDNWGVRIDQIKSLDPELVSSSLSSQAIAEIPLNGGKWEVIPPVSPYNNGPQELHVMVVEGTKGRYLPDLTSISVEEGTEVMQRIVGRTLKYLENQPGNRLVCCGFNDSPRAVGDSEEGYQSLITKAHFQIWNYRDFDTEVPLEEVPEGARWAIAGDRLKRLGGEYICKPVLEKHGAEFLNLAELRVDSRGVEVPLLPGRLSDVVNDPYFFAFLKLVAIDLDNAARNITDALTDIDNQSMIDAIKGSFENGTNGVVDMLRKDPELLPFSAREEKIKELEQMGYSRQLIHAVHQLSWLLKNRSQVSNKANWIRKGLGYAMVFEENLAEGVTRLRLSPGIFLGDKGGVVEATGVALTRREGNMATEEEKKRRMEDLKPLIEELQEVA